jgi:hypothetical protein
VSALDAKALARHASSAESLLAALSGIGKSKILYRIDQPVNVYSERIMVRSREPVVTGTRKTARGEAINTVTYQTVGVIIDLSAQKPPPDAGSEQPTVLMSVELSTLAASDTETAPGFKVPASRGVSVDHSEPLEFDRPLVMLVISSATPAEQAVPVAYVVRYMFRPPVEK